MQCMFGSSPVLRCSLWYCCTNSALILCMFFRSSGSFGSHIVDFEKHWTGLGSFSKPLSAQRPLLTVLSFQACTMFDSLKRSNTRLRSSYSPSTHSQLFAGLSMKVPVWEAASSDIHFTLETSGASGCVLRCSWMKRALTAALPRWACGSLGTQTVALGKHSIGLGSFSKPWSAHVPSVTAVSRQASRMFESWKCLRTSLR
mmetsp:Transcript_34536/g.96889  ORF Transcript_34536/g.96889 Transcript_34536/m.96889 type:complete len:201 (+) Transcript_34536:90-692(+)